MKKSYLSIFLLVFVLILAVSAVGAADLDDTSDSAIQAADDDADIVVSSDVDDVAISAADEGSDDEVAAASDSADVLAEPEEGNNFTSLQTKINSNKMISLDHDYTWVEGDSVISIDNAVTIIGNNHKIDANNNGGIFKINTGGALTLMGVTLVNGNSDNGGAIYNEGELAITDCVFTDNTASVNGGAIYNVGSIEIMKDSTFENNKAANYGGAIYTTTDLTISNSEFKGNDLSVHHTSGEYGGYAIWAQKPASLTINEGSKFTNNGASYVNGDKVYGAVAVFAAATISDCVFTNNAGRWGGAIGSYGYSTGTLTITGTKFNNNKAYNGGAVFSQKKALTVDTSEFIANEATDGGAIDHDAEKASGYDAVISNSVFDANKASRYGSAIIALSGFTYTGCNFTNNVASAGTATIHYCTNPSTDDVNFADSSITNCKFEDNSANWYGAVYFVGTKSLTVSGSNFTNNKNTGQVTDRPTGALVFQGNSLTVSDSEFNNNEANTYGAALAIWSGDASVADTIFDGNTAGGEAAAIYLNSGNLALSGNTIVGDAEEIFINSGKVTSQINVTILNGGSYITHDVIYPVNATITDDAGNLIADLEGITFVVDGASVDAVYDNGVYKGNLVLPGPGSYIVNAIYNGDLNVKTATINNYRGTFQDLQDKVTNAQDNKLDLEYDFAYTPELGDDIYVDGVVISDALTINGNGYTISGSNAARIFKVNAATTINNVTIADGNVTSDGGAAIYATAVLTIADSNFTNNYAPLVGTYGAVHTNTDASFDNCIFTDNTARWGGAIGAEGSGTITIKNSKFENNKANQGGAIDIEGYTLNIDNTDFIANEAVLIGGAIYTSTATTATISNSRFENNKAYQGGAINARGVLTVDTSEFVANEVTGTQMPDAQTWSSGGAMWLENKFTIKNSNFTDNYAEYNGAAVYYQKGAYLGASLIENSRFEDNHAGSYYGAVYYNGWDSLTVKDSDFINNIADKNRAGALFFNARNLEVIGGEFINNSASEGGAIYYTSAFISSSWANDNYKKLTIDGATFKDNTASSNGGAVYINNGVPTIKDSTFDGNTAKGEANAIYLNDGNLTLEGNTIVGNAAEIVVNNGEVISQINVTVMDNGTYAFSFHAIKLNATVTDDNGNIIVDSTFKFLVGETPVAAVYNATTKLYEAAYTPAAVGEYVVSMSYDTTSLNIETATISFARSLIDIQNMIDAAEEGATIELDADYAYIEEFDAEVKDGIVVDKAITIKGNGYTISGSNAARIFNVQAPMTLSNVTIADASVVGDGGAIYASADLNIDNAVFVNNVASQGTGATGYGGAILSTADSTVTIKDTLFEGNSAFQGGAIYAYGVLDIDNTVFDGNNKAVGSQVGQTWATGGAICTENSFTIKNTNFTNNYAYENGAALYSWINSDEDYPTSVIDNCWFVGNEARSNYAGVYLFHKGHTQKKNSSY